MNKYSPVLLLLGISLAYCAAELGRAWLILLWLAVDFLVVGFAYALREPRVLGKRLDGTLPVWSWILFLPYHALNLAVWHSSRLLSSEPATNEIGGLLVVGRRLLDSEMVNGCENWVDLTSEFQEPLRIRSQSGYICFPILDATAPDLERLSDLVRRLPPGRTFIHCAQGHGRTGMVALALLLSRDAAESIAAALGQIQDARPAVRLNSEQHRCAVAYGALLGKGA